MGIRRRTWRRGWRQVGGGLCGVMTAGLVAPLAWELSDGASSRLDWLDEVWTLYCNFRQTRLMAMAAQPGGQAAMVRILTAIGLACWIGRTLAAVAAENARRRRHERPAALSCDPLTTHRGTCRRAVARCRGHRGRRTKAAYLAHWVAG